MVEARNWGDRESADGRGPYSDPPGGWKPGDPRRQPEPSVPHIYEGEGFQLVHSAVIGAIVVAAGIVALVLGEVGGLLLLGGGCASVFGSIWSPYRVALDDSGVLLKAVVRRVRIPWDELEAVAPPWWDHRHSMLKWRRSRGFAVVTLQDFPDLHKMLVEIERRSPRTYVSS